MAQRIRGQEAEIVFTGPNGTEEGFKAIQSFEITNQNEVSIEGYLGETTRRRDDIWNGIEGRMELHQEDPGYLQFVNRVINRSKNRTQDFEIFNILVTLQFSDGRQPRVSIPNVFFGPLPFRIGGREEYIQGSVDFQAADIRYINI